MIPAYFFVAALAVSALPNPVPRMIDPSSAPQVNSGTTTSKRMAFDFVSIKVSKEEPPFRAGVEFLPGGRVNGYNVSARWLIEIAYQVPVRQGYVTGGDSWLDGQR